MAGVVNPNRKFGVWQWPFPIHWRGMVFPSRLLRNVLAVALMALMTTLPARALGHKKAEQAGANLFRDKGCPYCHGVNTEGTKKGPSLVDLRKTRKAPEIARQISEGGRKMPAFGDDISKDEIAQIVAWLRAKHRPVPTPPAAGTVPTAQPAQR
jgi:mono/diheme cytochrome c family protein